MRKVAVIALLALLGLLAAPALMAADLTAEDIVARLQANQVFTTSRMQGVMTVTDRFGTKETRFTSYSRGDAEALIEFTSTEEKGQKILRLKDEIYLYFPDAEEVIRLQGAALKDSVMGSDFSYEDLTGEKSLLGSEQAGGREQFVLELKAKGRGVAYPLQKLWVDAEEYLPLRGEYFA